VPYRFRTTVRDGALVHAVGPVFAWQITQGSKPRRVTVDEERLWGSILGDIEVSVSIF